jgi:hypothetical protein
MRCATSPLSWNHNRSVASIQIGVPCNSPVTATTTPVTTAPEQQHDNDDNEKQFHGECLSRYRMEETLNDWNSNAIASL